MRRWLPLLLLAAAVGAQELRYTLGVRDDADGPVTAQAVPLPLCLSASVFSALVARVAAAGLLPGGALESRTLFAPSDEAFDDALAKLGLSRGRFLASPPERLAETLALHVAAPGQPPLATRDVRGGAPAVRVSSALGAPPLLIERRMVLRRDVVYVDSGQPGMPPTAEEVDVQVPAWFVHVDAATIGTGGVQISSPDQGCFLLGHWRNVHILSAVLLPKEAARYAKEGPYAVMQTMLTLPRGARGEEFSAALFAPAAPPGARFPGVVFAHGQRAPARVYQGTLTWLASHGFLVLAPRGALDFGCPSCTFAQLDGFVADVAAAATWLAADARCDATRGVGLFGHSLGGGTVLLAAARLRAPGARVAAVLALAPAEGDICAFAGGEGAANASATAERPDCAPHAAAAALSGRVPVMLLAGEADSTCPIVVNARKVFQSARPPAALHVLRRGTHCFTELPGGWFGSECGVPPYSSAASPSPAASSPDAAGSAADGVPGRIDVDDDATWGAGALCASRLVVAPDAMSDVRWERAQSAQPAQLAVARRVAAAFFAAHAAGRADAAALLAASGTRAAPWLFADALMRLQALK